MRILLVAGSYPPDTGGTAQFMGSFVKGLQARGIEVDVASHFSLPPRGYLKRIEACKQEVIRRSLERKFDRIVASSWSPFAVDLPAPYDVFCHGMDLLEPSRSWRHRIVMQKTLGRASRVLANSRFTAGVAKECGAQSENTLVLHPGVDAEHFRPAVSRPNHPVILSLGRLIERKGFDVVLRALPQILRQFPDVRYVCAGDGPDQERLKSLAEQLRVSANVDWPGEVDENAKLRLYQSASVFAMPNRITATDRSVEGFGIVFLEAAACGVPIIAGNSGGAPDAVVNDVTGYLIDPADVDAIAKNIIGLLSSTELRQKMGGAGRQRVLKEFREDQIAERYLVAIASATVSRASRDSSG